jgi:hypothetical protein
MIHENVVALNAHTYTAAEVSPEFAIGQSAQKPLEVRDAVNWLRFLAKREQRRIDAACGGNEQPLLFQAHVLREAARHLESLSR